MGWFTALTTILGLVKMILDYLQGRKLLKEAEELVIAKQLRESWGRLEITKKIDKQIDDLSDADVDKLLDVYRKPKS